jgi:predicted glycosyltransferase
LRGKKFEPTGTVKMFYPEDLKPPILASLIRTHAYGFPQNVDIDIEGAKNTAQLLKKWIGAPQ